MLWTDEHAGCLHGMTEKSIDLSRLEIKRVQFDLKQVLVLHDTPINPFKHTQ